MKIEFTARDIAKIINGKIEGNEDTIVSSVAKIEEGNENAISFIANPKYEIYATNATAGILLVNHTLAVTSKNIKTIIRVEDPYMAFTTLLNTYQTIISTQQKKQNIISKNAEIEASATIGNDSSIGAFSYIGKNVKIGSNVSIYPQVYIGDNCEISDNTIIFAGVKIYDHSKIGKDCIIHAGAVIGSDGFGFAPKADGSWQKIPQTGNVIIEDDVEIGANTCIDRATMGATIIRKGVKLDNLIQVAHNVEIGENTAIAAQVGISGSTKLGKNMLVGGQAAFTGHLKIANGVKVQAKAAVKDNIETENAQLSGVPAINAREHYRQVAALKQLPDLIKKIQNMDKKNSQ